MKLVLDTNILVSAFLAPQGEDARVLRQAKAHELYLSSFILSEVYEVLHYPRIRKNYDYPDLAVDDYVNDLVQMNKLIDPQLRVEVCADPDDNAVLACAVAAVAGYLVTRNTKHFPTQYGNVKIVHPREFLALDL